MSKKILWCCQNCVLPVRSNNPSRQCFFSTQLELANACKIKSAFTGNEFPFVMYWSEIVDCFDIEVKEQLTAWLRKFSSVKISDELSTVLLLIRKISILIVAFAFEEYNLSIVDINSAQTFLL